MGSKQASAQKAMIGNAEPCPTPRDLQGMALFISARVLPKSYPSGGHGQCKLGVAVWVKNAFTHRLGTRV